LANLSFDISLPRMRRWRRWWCRR